MSVHPDRAAAQPGRFSPLLLPPSPPGTGAGGEGRFGQAAVHPPSPQPSPKGRGSRRGSHRLAAIVALLAVALPLGGCILPHIGRALEGRRSPVYVLEDRPTLVFVEIGERAQHLMGDPRLPRLIAARTGGRLVHYKRLNTVIDHSRVYDLAAKMGRRFYEERPAIDAIGRHVGAEQVIIIQVEAARLRQEPGMLEPQVVSRVRVIQTDPYRRLFPVDPDLPDDPRFQPEGHEVVSELPRSLDDDLTPERHNRVTQLMAEVVARDVARVFMYWDVDDEGGSIGRY